MFQSYWHPLREIIARKGWGICALIVLSMPVFQLYAIEITELQVYEHSGVYHIRVVAEFDAPVEYVHRVLQEELDWDLQLKITSIDASTVCGETCDSNTGQCQP